MGVSKVLGTGVRVKFFFLIGEVLLYLGSRLEKIFLSEVSSLDRIEAETVVIFLEFLGMWNILRELDIVDLLVVELASGFVV